MAVHFSKETKYVRSGRNSQSVGVRFYKKTSKDDKDYWEGAVQLDNGQYVWVSIFGSMKEHETSKGNVYIGGQIKITAPVSSRKASW